jgi:hypothetical protein
MKLIRSLLLCLLLLPLAGYAQRYKASQNRPGYYKEVIHFGFFLGANRCNFLVTPINDFTNVVGGDSLKTILSSPSTGFNLGIVSELRLHEYLTLRFTPDIAFGQRNLDYHFETNTGAYDIQRKIESTFLDFPLNLKVRSKRMNNFAAYMIGGGRYTLDLASQRDAKNQVPGQEIVKINKHDFAYDVGAGVDLFLPYFKFGVELKLTQGLRNLHVKDVGIYSQSLDRLRSQVFWITLTFEG